MLFKDLQRANTELAMAYDNTIEGWAYALDLRDKETEGHSRRVTELTLRIAVVDVWDAFSSDRPYRKAWQKEEIREYIRLGGGSHFDPEIVNLFIKMEL